MLLVLLGPYIAARFSVFLGWTIALGSGVVLLSALASRTNRAQNAATAPPITAMATLVAAWCLGLSALGLNHESAAQEESAARAVAQRVEADRAEAARKETEAREYRERFEQAQRREAQIAAELTRPWNERANEARDELLGATDDNREQRLCYAAWLVSRGPEGDKQVAALDRVRKKAERQELGRLRAEAMRYRSIVCRDGEISPSCMCNGSRRGCCSHHGGVAGCERIEEPALVCPSLDDRGYAALRLFGSTN